MKRRITVTKEKEELSVENKDDSTWTSAVTSPAANDETKLQKIITRTMVSKVCLSFTLNYSHPSYFVFRFFFS